MKLTEYTLENHTVAWLMVVLLIFAGIGSFNKLGRLEDPEFTIKQAVIITRYAGASPEEVEEEVTLPIENTLQQLPYVYRVTSSSTAGLSQVEVEMKSIYRKHDLAQIWDEMRRKIYDLQPQLPPGADKPIINDDFGDVYGLFIAVTGEGFSHQELTNYLDFLRRELVLVDGVGKVSTGGVVPQRIYIEVSRAKLAASGLSVDTVRQLLKNESLVNDAGHVHVGSEYVRIHTRVEGAQDIESLAGLLLGNRDGRLVYLADVATITRGYQEPVNHRYRFNGKPALTLGVSFASGTNVVDVGKAVQVRLDELAYARPIGVSLDMIYNQSAQVEKSVNSFIEGLLQAVVVVIVVLMFTMGWRPGVIMSAILLLTIAGTFIAMHIFSIELHRISLGALIIALGMLVDNAIVITEGILIGLQRGLTKTQAAIKIVGHTRWPLLGATVIAITAFAPIGLSPDASGEFTGSLFWVLFISLLFSWVLAVTLTPFFCYLFIGQDKTDNSEQQLVDPYRSKIYTLYRRFLHLTLHFRWTTLGVMALLLVSAILAFGQVNRAFFPDSSLPVLLVDYWLPQGTAITATEQDVMSLEQKILAMDEVTQITTTIGRGAQRFMLTYAPEKSYPGYAQFIVEMKNYEGVASAQRKIADLIEKEYPHVFARYRRSAVGPATAAKIEARISGPNPDTLRAIGHEIQTIFLQEPDAINVYQDWRGRTKVLQPVMDSAAARRLGISRADLDRALKTSVVGEYVGTYREGSDLIPIVLRSPAEERSGADQLEQVQVFSPVLQHYVNASQFVRDVEVVWEDPIIKRRDRKRTFTVLADPAEHSNPFALLAKLKPLAEAVKLPPGYALGWGGEYEAQQKANKAVFTFVPLGVLVMIIITVVMFNSIKQTLVVWLTVPLAVIGVAYGLLVTGAPFSFTALLAILSLVGMQIKNGIVLVEEIKRLQEEEQLSWHRSISEAAVSRLRPVSMAAVTTILGMLPLLGDVFFQPMAVTIMFGLGFATVLSLIIVPVLFALFYGVRE